MTLHSSELGTSKQRTEKLPKVKLHRHPLSGHSHRAELFLSLLNIAVELINVDLANGEHKTESFLKLNLLGQLPVLEDQDTVVSDSNGILVYLAETYDTTGDWYPTAPVIRAEIQRFLSIAANQVANGPAAARLVTVFGRELDHDLAIAKAHSLLNTLNQHFENRPFAVTNKPTIADIALYTYIAHAPEGNVSLKPYPGVTTWLKRIEALPGFKAMTTTKIGFMA